MNITSCTEIGNDLLYCRHGMEYKKGMITAETTYDTTYHSLLVHAIKRILRYSSTKKCDDFLKP